MNYQAVLFLWIIGGIAAVIGMVLFFVRRKENRRLAEIKEAKDAFSKRVGIPQKYAKVYEDATTERDIIAAAILIAQSCQANQSGNGTQGSKGIQGCKARQKGCGRKGASLQASHRDQACQGSDCSEAHQGHGAQGQKAQAGP